MMLGHGKPQGEMSNVFRLITPTATPAVDMVEPLLFYLSRYSDLVDLLHVVGRGNLFHFLDLFAGQTFSPPRDISNLTAADTKYTLYPEVLSFCGEGVLEKFLETFAGRSFRVPPSNVIRAAIRDVDVYLRMVAPTRNKNTVASMANHYNTTKAEIWWLYRRVAAVLGEPEPEDSIRSKVDSEETKDV